MARRFSGMRKDRMWLNLCGTVLIGAAKDQANGNLLLAGLIPQNTAETASETASFLRGYRGPNPYNQSPPGTLRAAREFTISSWHMVGVTDQLYTIHQTGFIGVGVQGGGQTQNVDALPMLGQNENTGQWPLVVPIVPVGGAGLGAGRNEVRPDPGRVVYSLSGQSKAQRKVKLGQSLYVSAWMPRANNTGAVSLRVTLRVLCLL